MKHSRMRQVTGWPPLGFSCAIFLRCPLDQTMKAFMGLLMWSICLEPGPILASQVGLCLDFTSLMDSALVVNTGG